MISQFKRRIRNAMGPKFALAVLRLANFGFRYQCPVCSSHVRRLLDQGYRQEVLYKYIVEGGIPRRCDECPVCRANDRTRLVYLYITKKTDFFIKDLKVLHCAPERAIVLRALSMARNNYICADIEPATYMKFTTIDRIDIQNTPYMDGSFDFVICNHVLEHVPDDRRAMREIYRILAPGGRAILQVPLAYRLDDTLEDPSLTSAADRLRAFGQADHVRLYAKDDYIRRLKDAGFRVEEYSVYAEYSRDAFDLDINPHESLIVGWKSS